VGIHDNFHELGGHSLLATQIISRVRRIFQVDLPLRTLFENPTVASLALAIQAASTTAVSATDPPLEPANRQATMPLSFAQQRLWFLEQLEPGNLFYNIPSAIRLSGALDEAALQQSVNEIVRRHEALRTRFTAVGGAPRQQIVPTLSLPLPVEDLQHLPLAEQEAAARARITAELQRPFDLTTGPLLRLRLLKLAPTDHIAILTMHHIIADGWSMNLFVRELATLYQAFVAKRPSPLAHLPLQYADFAHWQQRWLQGEVRQRQLAYWQAQLKNRPLMLNLPTDRPRPAVQSWRGAVEPFDLPPALAQAIRQLSQQQGVTLFMTLLAAYQTLLHRLTGQTDISVGTAVANRNHAEIEGLIGFFVNTLVMRTDLSDQPTFPKLLQRVRDVALGAYAHQDLPFEMLVEALQPERNLSHTPLFQVAFALQQQSPEAVQLPGLTWTPLPAESGTAKFDLTLEIAPHGDGLRGYFEYNTDLFDRHTIQRWAGHFHTLLAGIAADPDQPIAHLPLLTPAESRQILFDWNETAVPFPHNRCIHHLFEAHASAQPQAVALLFEDTSLSYGQLNRRANQLARFLQQQGVGPESLVGIAAERSVEMVVAILAVLKAGGAYLPLDPTYPAERLAFMIQDSGIGLLLTQAHLLDRLPTAGLQLVCLAEEAGLWAAEAGEDVATAVSPDHLAYVIYTSGSTGKPKGALLAHRGLCNLVSAQQRLFDIRPNHSRVLQFSPLSFDASVWEMFMALANGAALVLARQEVLASPPALLSLLQTARVTNVTLPPSVLALLPSQPLPDLETVIAAGEACSAELVQTWAPGRAFFNAYGPTETTVCASIYRCHPAEQGQPADWTAVAQLPALCAGWPAAAGAGWGAG
jgi:amino acid adenylation domain-containing protein